MDVPFSIIVGGLIVVAALVAPRLIGPTSRWRRRLPGVILVGLGLGLLGSQLGAGPERLVFGVALLVAWAGVGAALIALQAWARIPGLILAGAGILVAGWVDWRTDQWANGVGGTADRGLVDLFFLADGPSFSWLEVALGAVAFAVLSAIAGGFLLLPFRKPGEPHGAAPSTSAAS